MKVNCFPITSNKQLEFEIKKEKKFIIAPKK